MRCPVFHVPHAESLKLSRWGSCAPAGGLHRLEHAAEALLRDRGDQRGAIGEVAIGGGVGDAGAPRDLPHRQCADSAKSDEREGLRDQGVAGIFGPGTRIPVAAADILKKLSEAR